MTDERTEPDHESDDRLLREAGMGKRGGSSEAVHVTRTEVEETPSAPLPKRIGQYRIKRAIASGGMGTVYEAIQEKPRRTVALKLMRAGIASRSALRRFEFESQLLARLRHPGIAQVYDAGTHRDGEVTVPYFAMEYIVGAKAVTDYAKEKKLGTRERMALMAKVCEAVHHGHQKGIIHRDLKPSNILVDGAGQVKVIDFGVARCTDSDMAVTTLQTDVGQLIGTLQYMSPEQCAADPHDIDTRSDVYALGVVFYEMLAERMPYAIKGAAIHEATRVIREQEPSKLSILNKTLRGDVETIVLKALEKDRNRRYQSASALTADINRYLNKEAISARPPSMVYQLQVFARRHKGFFRAVAAVFLVLVAGVIVSSSLYFKADRAARRAMIEASKSEQVADFMSEMLNGVGPSVARGRDTTMLMEILDQTAQRVGAALADQPEVEATLRATLGKTYLDLGESKKAEPHLRRALEIREGLFGDGHLDVAASLYELSKLLFLRSDYAGSAPLGNKALRIRRSLLGDAHESIAESLDGAGYFYRALGDYAKAELYVREALAMRRRLLGNDHPDVGGSLNDLSVLLMRKGDLAGAEVLFRESLATGRNVYGDMHLQVSTLLNNLALLLVKKGDRDRAEPLYREALAIKRNALGNEHPDVAWQLRELGQLWYAKGDYGRAEPLLRETLAIRRRLLGSEHGDTTLRIDDFDLPEQEKGDGVGAELLHQEVEAINRKLLGNEQADVALSVNDLGRLLYRKGDYTEAQSLLREALAARRRALGDDQQATLTSINNLGAVLNKLGRHDESAALLLAGEAAARRVHTGDNAPRLGNYLAKLGEARVGQGEYAAGEKTLLETHALVSEGLGEDHKRTTKIGKLLISLYESWDAVEPGKGYAEKAAGWRAKLPEEEKKTEERP